MPDKTRRRATAPAFPVQSSTQGYSTENGCTASQKQSTGRKRTRAAVRAKASSVLVAMLITGLGLIALASAGLVVWLSHVTFGGNGNEMPRLRRPEMNREKTQKEGTPQAAVVSSRDVVISWGRYSESAPDCQDLDPDDVSYTLVTQLSTDRIWMMRHHCNRWGDGAPISVAVFTDSPVPNVTDQLVELGCTRERLTVQTMGTEEFGKEDYPVNRLRNVALSAVKTSHVMYVDADFWEAEDLHSILNLREVRETLSSDPKLVAVIPAFQITRQCREYRDCRKENVAKMPKSREDMMNMVKKRQGNAFDPTNRHGHDTTNYVSWFRQGWGSFAEIPCVKSNRYEPYMAFRYCRDLPPFQEAFTGYGKNKMTMVMQMRRSGYLFSQLGGAFVVHYPHLDSPSRLKWNKGPMELRPHKNSEGKVVQSRPEDIHVEWNTFKRGQVDRLFVQFRSWLYAEVPDEARLGLCDNVADDDVKLWIDRSELSQ